MANVDAAPVEQIFEIPKLQREADVEHHRQADDLGAGLEVLERETFCHDRTLAGALPRLKASLSDKTFTKLSLEPAAMTDRTMRKIQTP